MDYRESKEDEELDEWVDIEEDIEQFDFNQKTGLKVNVGNNPKPFNIFSIFCDDAVLSHVMCKTNLYAKFRFNEADVTRRSKVRNWTDLTVVELRTFLGVCLLFGQIKKPTMYNYFHKEGLYVVPSIT